MRCLVPDLSATQEIDPVLEQMNHEIGRWESAAKSDDKKRSELGKKMVKELSKLRDDWVASDEEKPSLTIGYMPPAKRTAVKNESLRLIRLDEKGNPKDILTPDDMADNADKSDSIDREVVSWGLRGWNLVSESGPIGFDTESVKVAGVEFKQAAPEMVSVVEAMGWLEGTSRAILEFNTLSTEEKKRS